MIKQKINKTLEWLLIMLMTIMVINVLWQVFTRYVLDSPSSFTDELARYLLMWVGLLGAAYASGKNMHLAINIFPSRLEVSNQRMLAIFVNILIIGFALTTLVIGGGRLVYITSILGQKSAALHISLAQVYSVIPLSGLLIIFYKLFDITEKKYQ